MLAILRNSSDPRLWIFVLTEVNFFALYLAVEVVHRSAPYLLQLI